MYTKVGPNWNLYDDTQMTNPCSYTASKCALEGITRWMSTLLAPKIKVNMVSPGGIEREQAESFQKRYKAAVPMQRFCKESEVAKAVKFLASEDSDIITGQNLMLDGGYTKC